MDIFSQSLPGLPQPFLMLPIEGGTFQMGDEHGDLWEACRPVHSVTVSDFYLGQYPVAQALWKAVMQGKNPSHFQGDDLPVETVSCDDAQAFIQKLNEMTAEDRLENHFYRLPTEAEWEYAARGGKFWEEGCRYAGSDRLKDVGWYDRNSHGETKPAGLKFPNELGLYDMSGNVWEWCEDDWNNDYRDTPSDGSAWIEGTNRGSQRVYRGGGCIDSKQYCRVAARTIDRPGFRDINLGFRLVLALQSVGCPPAIP